MNKMNDTPAKLAESDPVQWPIQIRQAHYGWTVTCYKPDGHVKHVLTADAEMEAYRAAFNLAKIYRVDARILVHGSKGELKVDLDKLLKARHS